MTPHCAVVTVVATYRRPQLLQRAVASALAQTVDDHHVVVVDDGGGELPSFPPSARLHVVQLPENTRSAGLVRNVGILLSRSTYVAFLDDDNTWLPDHLERALAVIDRERADACYLRMEVVDERGSAVAHVGRPFSRRALRRGNYIDLNALVARRSPDVLFSPMPRRRASTRKEDWELVYRLSRHGRIVYDPHVTVRYLRNPASHFSEWLP